MKPLQTIVCIRNGVPDNAGDEVLRINANAHPLELINDGDGNSFWLSNPIDDMSIQIDLGDQFQVISPLFSSCFLVKFHLKVSSGKPVVSI